MTVIRLADGTLMLHSPVALDPPLKRALDEIAPVRRSSAEQGAPPAHPGYVQAYPDALLCGAPGLAEKRPDLRIQHVLTDPPPATWPLEIALQSIDGAADERGRIFPPAELNAGAHRSGVQRSAGRHPCASLPLARRRYWSIRTAPADPVGMRDRAATRLSIDRILPEFRSHHHVAR
jgi:hypothetical protein